MSQKFTIIILTYNEEKNLPDCLKSLGTLNVPIFVVDSFSTDATLEILEKEGIQYVQNPFENYAQQRNWAQDHNPFHTEWVMHLDAGERLTPAMVNWIKERFDPDDTTYNGYMFSRKTMFMSKWIKHGGHYPNYHLRLYRSKMGKCEDKLYDQHFVVEGKKCVLLAGIDIIDLVADNMQDFILRHNRWALFEAVEILVSYQETGEVNQNFFGNPIERKRWLKNKIFQKAPLFSRSLGYFLYRYFIKMGFLDGKAGLIFHFLQGFWFRFLIDAYVFELKYKLKNEGGDLEEVLKSNYDPKLVQLLNKVSVL